MKIIKNYLPDIEVNPYSTNSFAIRSMQYFDEQDDRVIIKCAEYVDVFKRGFVCDLKLTYDVIDYPDYENVEEVNELVRDLVLVYVNKYMTIESVPEFEYIFYK